MRARTLVPAYNEAAVIADTVAALRTLPILEEVVVVDDGSSDETALRASSAGARVLRSEVNRGKGLAMEMALSKLGEAEVTLFVDADTGASAKAALPLVEEVLEDRADLAIGSLPRQSGHGGFRLVKGLARASIRALTGLVTEEPLSGQRAAHADVLRSVRPLASGFQVEVAMTIDALRHGFRVVEIEVPMSHSVTGRDLRGVLHRARQGRDLVAAVARRVR